MKRSALKLRWIRSLGLLLAQPAIGGQAVIEGVMMRSPHSFAVAVRRPDGTIVVREEAWLSFAERFPFLKWPLLRGANMLIESMANGLSALNFSAQEAMPEESESDASQAAGPNGSAAPAGDDRKSLGLWLTLLLSLAMAMAIFKGVPHLLTWGLGQLIGGEAGTALPVSSGWFHLVDGLIRLLVFAGYIGLISRMPDVKRLFMYHGAEHKSVHAFENKRALEVAEARQESTAHPRCGTSLILLVIAVSVFVFAALIPLLPQVSDNELVQALFALGIKIPMLLPVAGVAYEAQRLAAKYPSHPIVRMLIAPGMMMQRLTTREPGDPELEVALTALRKAWWREQRSEPKTGERQGDAAKRAATIEVFAHFDEVKQKVAA